MSRVGKHEVIIPSSLSWLQEGNVLKFKGKLGEDSLSIPDTVTVSKTEKGLLIRPSVSTKEARSMWGTTQRNLSNIVHGLTEGFTISLDLVGVGYRASVSGNKLTLQLGFSHDVNYIIPHGVVIKCEKPTSIAITAPSKQQAGEIAALLRSYRKPEPYKGKGVIRVGEFIVRKEGKKK